MKLCYNETVDSSDLENDLRLCEKYGYDLIEIRIGYLRTYLQSHTLKDLKDYFATHHIKPYAFNSVEDVVFCGDRQWACVLEDFVFACQMGAELDCHNIVVVPTTGEHMKAVSEEAVLTSSVTALRELSDIAAPYAARIAFEPIGNKKWCVNSLRQAARIIRETDRENVGLTIDAFNCTTKTPASSGGSGKLKAISRIHRSPMVKWKRSANRNQTIGGNRWTRAVYHTRCGIASTT